MKMHLYTLGPPQGSCLLLAKQLHQVTSMAGEDCVQIAQRLFANHFSREKPVTIEVLEPGAAGDLEVTCSELGITVEGAGR